MICISERERRGRGEEREERGRGEEREERERERERGGARGGERGGIRYILFNVGLESIGKRQLHFTIVILWYVRDRTKCVELLHDDPEGVVLSEAK